MNSASALARRISDADGAAAAQWAPATWLFARLVVGSEWLRAGWEKIGDGGWTASPAGAAVEGFLQAAIAKSTAGPHPEVPHWYHSLAERVFLPNAELLAHLVAYGEFLVGLALVLGVLTRVAALFGVTMNLAFLWAGVTSTNPPLLLIGLAIVFLGAGAGSYGVDRWLWPKLATAAGAAGLRVAHIGAVVALSAVAAWLLFVASDGATWLLSALLSAVAAFVAWAVSRPKNARSLTLERRRP